MPLPIQTQLFDAFLGTQEGIHSIILPDIFSSGGSKNVWMDRYARVKRILGYSTQTVSPITTDTGGNATRLRGLFPYRKTSGGSFTRQILAVADDGSDEWELWYSTDDGGTWTFIADLGSTAVGQIPDFEQFGDLALITNGKTAPRVWNGTTLVTAGSTQLGAPTTSSGGTGNLSGSFVWKLCPRKSDGTRKIASISSTALSLEGNAAGLTWTADADTDVVGYEVYRTTGTGRVFYYVDYVDGRTTAAYADNASDYSILENRVLEEHGDAPPTTYLAVAHKQRMWYIRTDAYPQRGYFSDPGDPDSVYAENFIEFQDAETQGDLATGGVGNFEGMLVVFEERSIWTVSGTGQVIGNLIDWTRGRTNAQTGSVSQRAIVRVPAGSRYMDQTGQVQTTATEALAYFSPLQNIRLFDGDNSLIISFPVSQTLATLNYAQRRKVHALHDTSRNEITWMFPDGSNSECSTAVAWNYRWGVWYIREWGFASAVEIETSTEAVVHLAGDASLGGDVFELWDGNTFDGVAFTAQWQTKTMYGLDDGGKPIPTLMKRWRWLDLLFETDQSVQIDVSWMAGGSPDNADPTRTVTVTPSTTFPSSSDGDAIASSDGDVLAVGEASTSARVGLRSTAGHFFHDKGIRLRVGDVASSGSWSLEAFTLAYQILPGAARTRPT